MACADSKADSEREEGEIIDDVDYLSDISSEEEFLLRQRLQVLESYNNVLERKRAKDLSFEAGKLFRTYNNKNNKLSVNNQQFHENYAVYKNFKIKKQIKLQTKHAKNKEQESYDYNKNRPVKKRIHKKKQPVKIVNESSEESEDEYRTKRKRLENAVTVNKAKIDSTSLKSRLGKMLGGSQDEPTIVKAYQKEIQDNNIKDAQPSIDVVDSMDLNITDSNSQCNGFNGEKSAVITETATPEVDNVIDLSKDEIKLENDNTNNDGFQISSNKTNVISDHENSDEDLELLRQHALKSKAVSKDTTNESEHKHQSEEEDSDTAELRIICLRSALLKRAFEKKKKEKLFKRLSQSTIQANFFHDNHEYIVKDDVENNTDIESVDMDIGSDGDEKGRELIQTSKELDNINEQHRSDNEINEKVTSVSVPVPDEPDEDEDLLRAKLLTSISRNLPHIIDPVILDTIKVENNKEINNKKTFRPPEEKKFIINLDGSDSEGEHEATKNLTKMHIKLSEQPDFQQKLDLFLKSTRMQVENQKLPDVVQGQNIAQPTEKFIPKTVNHLPKLEQIEYKKLVKRMAELEKIKKARQASLNQFSKETLKPRNITLEEHLPAIDLDEQIASSRKRIAEESASILKLKEEATKLTQKHKIVATELRNLTTAINLNKKQQRAAQNRLTTIRTQHQMLLKSTSIQQSKISNLPNTNRINHKNTTTTRLQKENYLKKEYKDPQALKCVKVSVVNDIKSEVNPNSRHSIQIDVKNNKKTVKLLTPIKDRTVDYNVCQDESTHSKTIPHVDNNLSLHDENLESHVQKCEKQNIDEEKKTNNADDYTSPLQSLKSAIWDGDPNAVLCPFEFAGRCKDTECKFLHPKIPSAK